MGRSKTSSVLEEDRVPEWQRLCLVLVGVCFSFFGVLLLFKGGNFVYGIYFGLAGLGALLTAVRGTWDQIEIRGHALEACPECGDRGSVEVYRQTSHESRPFSSVVVTTTTPMVNCTNSSCTYRRELNEHLSRRERTQALTKAYGNGDIAAAMDGPVTGLVTSSGENATPEDQLRAKRGDNRGSYQLHPESASLRAELGSSCPGCGGSARYTRWQRDSDSFLSIFVTGPKVLERVDMAECDGGGCGYIARLEEHKARIRGEASSEVSHALTEALDGGDIAATIDGSRVGLDTSTEERVSLTVGTPNETDRRRELREKLKDKRGSYLLHPTSELLRANFGSSCPECSGAMRYLRWQIATYLSIFSISPNVLMESIDIAECHDRDCGYIARLEEHKARVEWGRKGC